MPDSAERAAHPSRTVEGIESLEIGKLYERGENIGYLIEGLEVVRQPDRTWRIDHGSRTLGPGFDTLRETKRWIVDYLNGVPQYDGDEHA